VAKIINEISGTIFSLPWLVARDEGLFEREGIEVEFVKARPQTGLPRIVEDHRLVPSIVAHAPFEEGQAAVYRACEWGQIRRSYDSERGGRIVGKRSAIGIQALFSAPGSKFTHPQTLRNQPIGVRFHAGSHYATLQQLEGFLTRDQIKVVNIAIEEGYEAVKRGELAAISLMDPWITLAEKEGLQKIIETHYVGTEIASDDVDAASWEAANRALHDAVVLINADKRKYLHYLIDALPERYAKLISADDFHLPRLRYVDPEPYAREDFDQTNEWLVSWGLVNDDSAFDKLVDNLLPETTLR
jgi:NitT/TauT family transport system substrate-binding protein